MDSYQVITDSAGALSQQMVDELGIEVIPMDITLGSDTFKDYPDRHCMPLHDFYARIATGEPFKTNQVSPAVYISTFEKYLEAGTDVLYLSFSSGMSGTYNNSVMVAKELSEKYPDRKILTVDTLGASLGQGLVVWHAVQKKKAGAPIEEVQQWVQENNRHMNHWFTVNDLNHLKRGGRLSASAALVGTMLGIKPVLNVDAAGKLALIEKVRGRRQALNALVSHMEQTQEDAGNQVIFIGHSACQQDAEYVKDRVEEEFHPEKVVVGDLGPTISAHTSTDTIALFFLGKERK
jgi:DegV family protein with EDD domain